jgi:CheY-specific phosphatase CheX
MMGGAPPTGVDASVRDVIGEITNMVAGTFKNSLPGHSCLTLPCLIEGSDYSMDIIQGKRVISLSMLFEGRGLVLSVLEASRR